MRAYLGFLPVALERWVRAAVGQLSFDVAPWVALGALLLAVAPLLWAGAEREILTVSSADMVERNVPTTVTYVSLPGLAMSVRLPAPGSAALPPYGLLVRDTVPSDALTVVMTDTDPLSLRTRLVTGRLQSRPYADRAAEVFDRRGEATAGPVPGVVIIEVAPAEDETIHDVATIAELPDLAEGTLVRLALRFDGEAMATCALTDDGCEPRALAQGSGVFVHLAHGDGADASSAVLVQLSTPASVVAGQWQGGQVRNEEDLVDFVSSVPVQALAGWGRILLVASINDDPGLVRDRSWLGPIVLVALAFLLWLGGRLGYPYFRPMVEGGRRWASSATPATPGTQPASPWAAEALPEIPLHVSGHALTTSGQRRHLDQARAVIHPSALEEDGRMTAVLDLADGARVALAAYDTGVLGRVERGEVVSLGGVRPALWAHWYGTDLRMTFSTAADRDRAAELLGAGIPSVRSPS